MTRVVKSKQVNLVCKCKTFLAKQRSAVRRQPLVIALLAQGMFGSCCGELHENDKSVQFRHVLPAKLALLHAICSPDGRGW